MMAANAEHGVLMALPLRAGSQECARIAELCGAMPLSRADLQSGWAPDEAFGRALIVVAGLDSSVLVVPTIASPAV